MGIQGGTHSSDFVLGLAVYGEVDCDMIMNTESKNQAANVLIEDYSMWFKHISKNDLLVSRLRALRAGDEVRLRVGGIEGVWERKRDGRNNVPTEGLKPKSEEIRKIWFDWFRNRKGEEVEIELILPDSESETKAEESARRLETATSEDRHAAWRAFLALSTAGWSSDAPYGPREELHRE